MAVSNFVIGVAVPGVVILGVVVLSIVVLVSSLLQEQSLLELIAVCAGNSPLAGVAVLVLSLLEYEVFYFGVVFFHVCH
ncbi:hypothetical protein C2G38_646077 [Gigaspora rosea]|uniref:Uncharacterized protein n=1 Tax=Gigaspora rosea TaxID=44941 RepID=A0A397U701_9GLOM|nr:hypothetical protein C2G38_646077 [Gigaspora rosea]